MLSRLSRRQWAALIAVAPLAAQTTQKTPPLGAPASPQAPATPQARMQKANDDVRRVSDRLAHIDVPMDVEPAFAFRP